MALKDRTFIEARLATTTRNLRECGMLGAAESLTIEQTGGTKFPHRLAVTDHSGDYPRQVRALTGGVNYHGLGAAIDALYELSWNREG